MTIHEQSQDHSDDTSVEFRDTAQTLSESLRSMAGEIRTHGEHTHVRSLLELAGEQGLLLALMLLTIPFLVPISIPGVSTIFGSVAILISLGITFNRVPWLPDRLLDRPIETERLVPAIEKGSDLMTRVDRFTHPRLGRLTDGAAMNRLNGLALLASSVLLIFPLGLIPFSNTLPGWSILLLAAGMTQRDGLLILLGYLMLVATVIYFGALAVGAFATGQGLMGLIGS